MGLGLGLGFGLGFGLTEQLRRFGLGVGLTGRGASKASAEPLCRSGQIWADLGRSGQIWADLGGIDSARWYGLGFDRRPVGCGVRLAAGYAEHRSHVCGGEAEGDRGDETGQQPRLLRVRC